MFVRTALVAVAVATGSELAVADIAIEFDDRKVSIQSDGTAHDVIVEGVGRFGELRIYVDDVETAALEGVRDVTIELGAGNDLLFVNGLQIGGSLKVKLGGGNDTVIVQSDRIFESADRSVFVGRNVDIALGGQLGDRATIDADDSVLGVTIGGKLTIRDAADVVMESSGSVADDDAGVITIGADLTIRGKRAVDFNGDDRTISLTGVRVGGSTRIELGSDVDVVTVTDCAFARSFKAKLGGGDDQFGVGPPSSPSSFAAAVELRGGSGSGDVLQLVGANIDVTPTISQFEFIL